MKKALFIIESFKENCKNEQIYIKILQELGYDVHIVGNDLVNNNSNYTKIEFSKKLISFKNLKSYKKLKKLIQENDYEIIQCSNFITGVFARLANKRQNKKIVYSIENFEFYRKQFFVKKIFYYLIEKFLSRFTHTIIVGNKEDYVISKSKFYAKHVKLIKIINEDYLQKMNKNENMEIEKSVKENLGLNDEDYIFLNISDFCKKENHIMQLESMIDVIKIYPQAKLIICGEGNQKEFLENIIVKYGLDKNVIILENTEEIYNLINICDCYLTTTCSKGNINNIVLAMQKRKPILATNIKEYRDLLKNKNLFDVKDIKTLKYKMIKNIEQNNKTEKYYNIEKYKIEKVIEDICKIYINKKRVIKIKI